MLTLMHPDSFSNDHVMWTEAIRGAQERSNPSNGVTMTRLGAGKHGPRLAIHSGLLPDRDPAYLHEGVNESIDLVFPVPHREHVKALTAWARDRAAPAHPIAVLAEATDALARERFDPERFLLDFWYPEDGLAPRETAVWAALAAEASKTHEVFVTTRSESVLSQVAEHVRVGDLDGDSVRVMFGRGPEQDIGEASIDREGRVRNFPISWFGPSRVGLDSGDRPMPGGYRVEDMEDAPQVGEVPERDAPAGP